MKLRLRLRLRLRLSRRRCALRSISCVPKANHEQEGRVRLRHNDYVQVEWAPDYFVNVYPGKLTYTRGDPQVKPMDTPCIFSPGSLSLDRILERRRLLPSGVSSLDRCGPLDLQKLGVRFAKSRRECSELMSLVL